jgi:hypothetical protein
MKSPQILRCLALALAVGLNTGELKAADAAPGTIVKFLSGTGKDDAVPWDFFCTAGMQSGEWKKIPVPSCWELQGFGVYNYGTRFRGRNATNDVTTMPGFASEQGKYKTEFDVPADWKGKVVRIVFEGVMVKTEVFVNGQSAGPAHEGSFYEFKYDITPLLKIGEKNLLEVTVSKVADNLSIMRAERQGDYWNFGGIFRPVFLEVLPSHYIDWTGIDAKANGDFKADLHFGAGTSPFNVKATAQLFDAQNQPVGNSVSADPTALGDRPVTGATLAAHFDGVKQWTAETPNLYSVRFSLLENGVPGHVITNRFAFRTFELRTNDGLYLNGQKIIMKGVNRHSLWADSGRTLSRELCFEDARLIKDMNMNAVRMSHYPPDRDFLDACDELGLYVLDELTGWQGNYDTPSGVRLVGEMVRRDVNHPSILVWDNGNEGGWNNALDVEFGKWDIQQRHVMHPRSSDHGVNDPHYPDYSAVVSQSGGPAIYFPTEYLHGIYDGGLGSGFHDFWSVMSKSPVLGGAFFWVFSDDGVVRTDKGGIIDNTGDQGPDGIMGPRHEKEGSYYTIKEIWSPVEIQTPAGGLAPGFKGSVGVENHYDFTDLGQCKFLWEYVSFPGPKEGKAGHTVLASGELSAPSVPPHGSGTLNLDLPQSSEAKAVYFTAKNPAGQTLWTWTWPVRSVLDENISRGGIAPTSKESDGQLIVTAGSLVLQFDKTSGFLAGVTSRGKAVSVGNGPRFIAYTHDSQGRGARPTTYRDVAGTNTLASLTAETQGNRLMIKANYSGEFKQATWQIAGDGQVKLSYTYDYTGPADLLGVTFDYPETSMKGITWFGMGPYHVWQNRLQGTKLDVWQNAYNDTVPSVIYTNAPEFKGFFRNWRWATFDTTEGKFAVATAQPESYLGVYTPKDGPVGPLLALPQTGLSVLDVIPAMRTKFLSQERMGPQSAQKQVSGEHSGEIAFDFSAN